MTSLFQSWWTFCQLPDNDGNANDATNDGAGPTRWGWTLPTWRTAQRFVGNPNVSVAAFNLMSQAGAGVLAKLWLWNRFLAPAMAPGVNISIVDWAWTSGGAVHEIQHELGVTPDGVIGHETITALAAHSPVDLIQEMRQWRIGYYNDLGFAGRFPGLYRRAADCGTLSLQCAADVN